MDDKHPLGFGAERVHPGQQALAVGMTRKARQLTDLCLHVDGLTEQLDIDGAIDQGAPQRSHGLIAHKKDRALRPPQIVLEVVADAACLAHAAGRDDDLGHPVGVDHPGLIAGHADLQPRELDGVDALGQQRPGILVKAVGVGIFEDAGRLNGKGAVDVDREIAVAGDQPLFFDLPDKVEQLLGTAHRKAGDDHIAAPVKGALQDPAQLPHIVRAGTVAAVAIRRLHKHIVCVPDRCRVLDDGLMLVADVPGKDQLGGGAALSDPDLDAGRTQQMAHIDEADHKARGQLDLSVILHAPEQLHGRLGILHGVHRLHRLGTGTLRLAVLPLSFKLLNVGRVPQHDAAQLSRGLGGIDPAPEAVAHQQRQLACVVDMRMGHQHAVNFTRCHREGLVLVDILALLHAAVDEVALPSCFQQSAAARDLVVGSQKCELHRYTSQFGFAPLV